MVQVFRNSSAEIHDICGVGYNGPACLKGWYCSGGFTLIVTFGESSFTNKLNLLHYVLILINNVVQGTSSDAYHTYIKVNCIKLHSSFPHFLGPFPEQVSTINKKYCKYKNTGNSNKDGADLGDLAYEQRLKEMQLTT